MSPWASSGSAVVESNRRAPSRWLVVGNPDSRRVALFQEALATQGLPPAVLLAWSDLLAGQTTLDAHIRPGDRVRIESPGRDFAVEKQLLALGADEPDEDGEYAGIDRRALAELPFDKGEILCPRQWYRGFRRALRTIAGQLAAAPAHTALSDPADIALLFDKPTCQTHLADCGVPVPRPLGIITGYADLVARMERAGIRRVFVKLAHGSSASGVIAYRYAADVRQQTVNHQAMTTVETESARLFNSRRVRCLHDQTEIAALVDALCRHRVCAEEWLPKPSLPGFPGAFDVRSLTIGGRLRHVVGRCSRTPMTNLHLLNQRATADDVRARVGESAWSVLDAVAAHAATAFPRSQHIGLDITWMPGFRRLAVLEANAFGDLLPGTCSEGESTYEAEIRAAETEPMTERLPC